MDKYLRNFLDETPSVGTDLVKKIIEVADKHNVDRDYAIRVFLDYFAEIIKYSTFKYLKLEEDKEDV